MNIETRKLRIIEAFATLKDIKKINQIESLLWPAPALDNRKVILNQLSGAWTEEEAEEIKKIIQEGCENVDESEW